MRILVIGNPISGGGRARRRIRRLADGLVSRGHHVEVYLTRAAGDARDRAAQASLELDRLVVVGGDGTLNEVLNGLRDPARIPLCQLGTGTANILAHELGLPTEPEALTELLHGGAVRRLDMGRIGERRFLMVVSAGFDAMVTRDIRKTRKGTLGYAGYMLPIIRVLKDYRAPRITVQVDGQPPVAGELVVVSNTRNYGGLFTLADRASPDSGHLDVCVLTRASMPGLLRVAAGGLTGGISGQKGVVYMTGHEISLDSEQPVAVEVDGDFHGETPVRIGVEHAHVPFLVPPYRGEIGLDLASATGYDPSKVAPGLDPAT